MSITTTTLKPRRSAPRSPYAKAASRSGPRATAGPPASSRARNQPVGREAEPAAFGLQYGGLGFCYAHVRLPPPFPTRVASP